MNINHIGDDFNSLFELTDYFKDEQTCRDYLAYMRWGKNDSGSQNCLCPYCGCPKCYHFSDGKRYKYSTCRKIFTVKVNTLFEDTKVSLKRWFMALYLVVSHKKGISSHQLAKDIDVTQKTAWFMIKRIHKCFHIECIECLKNEVEADETYIGGKNKNRHKDKKVENAQGRSTKDKTPVFGLVERSGMAFAKVIKDTQSKTLYPIIQKSLKKNTTIYTDEYGVYVNLSAFFPHEIVVHSEGKYVIGDAHTNTMENFWSHLKRMIIGIHHWVSPKHLQLYVDSQLFRYNTRKISEHERFNLFLHNKIDHRTTYKQLTNEI